MLNVSCEVKANGMCSENTILKTSKYHTVLPDHQRKQDMNQKLTIRQQVTQSIITICRHRRLVIVLRLEEFQTGQQWSKLITIQFFISKSLG